MNTIIARLKTPQYQAALLGALFTVLDANGGFISQFFPAQYRGYIVMAWPVIMLTVHEMTTGTPA